MYPVYCEEEQICKPETALCGGKCLDPERPSIYVDYYKGYGFTTYCVDLALVDCIPEGSVMDRAHYICDGMCIPAFIPCNHSCYDNVLVSTNRREELYGPLNCSEIDKNIPDSNKIYLQDLIDFNGYCVPGLLPCNESCTVDSRRPLLEQRKCVEVCGSTRERPCNGRCIKNDEVCNNTCGPQYLFCSGNCIYKKFVCNGYLDCPNGEDEMECPENCSIGLDSSLTWERKYSIIELDQNGHKYCPQDKVFQENTFSCNNKMKCDNGTKCVPLHKINDGVEDCNDGMDEDVDIDMTFKLDEWRQEYGSYEYLWLCNGEVKNLSDPCNGECNSKQNMKLCAADNGTLKCIPNHQICPSEGCGFLNKMCNSTPTVKCSPVWNNYDPNNICDEYDWNMTISVKNGVKCKYHKR